MQNPRFIKVEAAEDVPTIQRLSTLFYFTNRVVHNYIRQAELAAIVDPQVVERLGGDAWFEMIGELDPRPDLFGDATAKQHASALVSLHEGKPALVEALCVAHEYAFNFYLHAVPRWPGYYLAAVARAAVHVRNDVAFNAYVTRLHKGGSTLRRIP